MLNNTSAGTDYESACPNNQLNGSFELASPWRRIGAILINFVLWLLVSTPFLVAVITLAISRPVPNTDDSVTVIYNFYQPIMANILATMLLNVILLLWQWGWMGRYGQSIGKRVLGIKVVGLNGEKLGFNGIVLVREVSFYFLVLFSFSILNLVFSCISFMGFPLVAIILAQAAFIIYYLIPLICLVMLFIPKIQRRTLQDLLAKTIVIRVRKAAK